MTFQKDFSVLYKCCFEISIN